MKFPIDAEDSQGIKDAINYLLSGPSALGQNFQGMSQVGQVPGEDLSDRLTYFTGNLGAAVSSIPYEPDNRPIWSTPYPITVDSMIPIDITGTTDLITIQVTFDPLYETLTPLVATSLTEYTAQNLIFTVTGAGPWSGTYQIISAIFTGGSSSELTCRQEIPAAWPVTVYPGGGIMTWNFTNDNRPTDCQAVVTVTGPSDRVFISNQTTYGVLQSGTWQSPGLSWLADDIGDFDTIPAWNFQINRYRAVSTTTLTDGYILPGVETFTDGYGLSVITRPRVYQGYIWQLDETILSVPVPISNSSLVTPGSGEVNPGLVLFTNVIDNPGTGYWWYVLEIEFNENGVYTGEGRIWPISVVPNGLRSFTAQVIKQ